MTLSAQMAFSQASFERLETDAGTLGYPSLTLVHLESLTYVPTLKVDLVAISNQHRHRALI